MACRGTATRGRPRKGHAGVQHRHRARRSTDQRRQLVPGHRCRGMKRNILCDCANDRARNQGGGNWLCAGRHPRRAQARWWRCGHRRRRPTTARRRACSQRDGEPCSRAVACRTLVRRPRRRGSAKQHALRRSLCVRHAGTRSRRRRGQIDGIPPNRGDGQQRQRQGRCRHQGGPGAIANGQAARQCVSDGWRQDRTRTRMTRKGACRFVGPARRRKSADHRGLRVRRGSAHCCHRPGDDMPTDMGTGYGMCLPAVAGNFGSRP